MEHTDFVHLHIYSDHSIGHSICKIDSIIDKAIEYKMPAIALTDVYTMSGIISFYHKAIKKGIRPILGTVVPVISNFYNSKNNDDQTKSISNMILIAKNRIGYHNIIKILSNRKFYNKAPVLCTDLNIIEEFSDSIIGILPQSNGEISRLISDQKEDIALNLCEKYLKIFKEDIYFELENTGFPYQKLKNELLYKFHPNIRCIAANRTSYIKKEHSSAYEIMLAIIDGKNINDRTRRKISTEELYFKTADKMHGLFSEYPDSLTNTVDIAEKCSIIFHRAGYSFPAFKTEELTSFDYLKKIIFEKCKLRSLDNNEYIKRIEYELSTIKTLGISDYFIVIYNLILEAYKKNYIIFMKGKITNSLIAYFLDITPVDPVLNDLEFDDFITVYSTELPLIEIETSNSSRQFLKEYLKTNYNRVANITSFYRMRVKHSLKDVSKVLNIKIKKTEELLNIFKDKTFRETINSHKLSTYFEDKETAELLRISKILEGTIRYLNINHSIFVISEKDITNKAPIENIDGDIVIQYDLETLKHLNFVQIHLNTSKIISVIENCIKGISEKNELDLLLKNGYSHIRSIIKKRYYTLLKNGYLCGLPFVNESIKPIINELNMSRFNDLMIICAFDQMKNFKLNNKIKDKFLLKLKNKDTIEHNHNCLKKTLKKTYYQIIFKEQISEIGKNCASLNKKQRKQLTDSIIFWDEDHFPAIKDVFFKGLKKHRFSEEEAEELFDELIYSRKYAFSKAESVNKAFLLCLALFLKKNNFIEYNVSAINIFPEKKVEYINELYKKHKKILLPDINESCFNTIIKGNAVLIGLNIIKGIHYSFANEIIEQRGKGIFNSFENFCKRVVIPSEKVLENLIYSGVFDRLGWNRAQMINCVEKAYTMSRRNSEILHSRQTSFLDINIEMSSTKLIKEDIQEYSYNELWEKERKVLGFYHETHPLIYYGRTIKKFHVIQIVDVYKYSFESIIVMAGIILNYNIKKVDETEFVYITIQDLTGTCIVQFIKDNIDILDIREGNCILCKCILKQNELSGIIFHGMKFLKITKIFENISFKIIIKIYEDNIVSKLHKVLEENRGENPVFIEIEKEKESIIVETEYKIVMTHSLLKRIEDITGEDTVIFKKTS